MLDKKSKEKRRGDQDEDSSSAIEEYDEELKCCVCLDLVYKPVVLGCGHMSCFWCVFDTMGDVTSSCCPVCRHPFDHFPRICKILHSVILELFPRVYKRRELQVKEEERQKCKFSPHLWHIHSGQKLLNQKHVLCASCNKLLYRPVVLNCGHVYCEECLVSCKCSVCNCLHPNGIPNRCFALEHLIKLHLPDEFEERKLSSLGGIIRQFDSTKLQKRKDEIKIVSYAENVLFPAWVKGEGPVVHYGIGCDHCGVLPITGNRYNCIHCNGTSFFDLCEQCFTNSLNLPGRFDQKHDSMHDFIKIRGAKISFAAVWQMNENAHDIITPYVAEPCSAKDREQSKGPSESKSIKTADHKPPRRRSF